MYLSPVYHIFASLSGQLVADTEGSPVSKGQGSGPDVGLLVPTSLPSYAEHLDPQLVAFSIEADRWPDWAGHKVGEPNPYTQQLLANLQQRIGLPPAIRVGADSEDRTCVDLSLQVGHAEYPPKTPSFPYPEARRISIGRDWYALSHNFAQNTPFTWGLNLKSLDIDETIRQSALLAAAFPAKDERHYLEAVEIGNEPELYVRQTSGGGVDNPGDWSHWSVNNYTQTWSRFAKAVSDHVELGRTVLRVGDIQFAGAQTGWSPQSVIQAGLFEDEFHVDHTKIFSEHMYQAGFILGHEAASGTLMDKGHIRGNLSLRAPDIIAARRQGLAYVLGETSTYSGHGSPGTSDVAEAALWAIDYLLYAASLGVSRVYLSHGVGYRYSSFQPIGGIRDDGRDLARPHILPLYYGLLVVNEAIGTGSAGRHVAEFSTEHPHIVSYGIYEAKVLVRIVVVNTHVYSKGRRETTTVALNGVSGELTLKRLSIPHTAAQQGLTWAGQDFDHPTGNARGRIACEQVENRRVSLEASSGVIIYLA